MSTDERLLAVFRGVFGDELDELPNEASPDTIADWDSLNHVNLVMALEAEFGVEFEADEISELASVGAIRRRLLAG
jgi:acyl carrier protein